MNAKFIFITFCVVIGCGFLHAHEVKEAQTKGKTKAPEQKSGKIYLLSEYNPDNSKTGYYKIGKSTQKISKRISDLQGGNPRRIGMVEVHEVPDMDEAEIRAHDATSKWNTKKSHGGGSEWFYVPNNEYTDFHNKFVESVTKKKVKPSLVSLLKAMMRMI